MSEDIINKNTEAENGTEEAAASNSPAELFAGEPPEDDKLNEELEQLKETFQQTYEETFQQAQAAPVIQELEDTDETEGVDEGEEDEGEKEAHKHSPSGKDQEKKTKRKKLAIILPVLLCVLIIVPLTAYFVISVTNPNFSSFISAMSKASAAEEYDEKLSCYEDALELCSDDNSFQKAMKQVIVNDIVDLMYKEKGYTQAYSYITKNLSEDEIKNPSGTAIKTVLRITERVNTLAGEALPLILNEIEQNGSVNKEQIAERLNAPSAVSESITSIISSLCDGAIYNSSSSGIEDASIAANYYYEAYSNFVSLGADSQSLCEKMASVLYENGYIFEAISMASGISPESEPVTDAYKNMLEDIKEFSSFNASVYELALELSELENADESAAAQLIDANSELADNKKAVLADLVALCTDAITAENERNLTKAASSYQTVLDILGLLNMSDAMVSAKCVSVMFDFGNIPDAQSVAEQYISDEVLAACSDEFKAKYAVMQQVFVALEQASEVFSPYFSQYYSNGTPIDFEAVSAELDALITDDSNVYDEGFVNYCKYYASMYSETPGNADEYLLLMHRQIPDLPFVYGYYLMDYYIADKDYDAAASFAQELLALNIADDYCNNIVAFCRRAGGDVDASLNAALRGIELSGTMNYSAKQAAIAYMLKGEFENAYVYLKALYTNAMSMESCDLMKIFNALYTGDNAEIKSELESTLAEIEQVYASYGITGLKNTAEILEGTKTLEDVFLSGTYELVSEDEAA